MNNELRKLASGIITQIWRRKLRRVSFLPVIVILTVNLFIITGCGEDVMEEEPARILKTDLNTGDETLAAGNLTIVFDLPVTSVMVNGAPADVDGTEAFWVGQSLGVGEQTLTIQWTDENGNTGSAEMTLTVREISILVC